VIDVSALQMLLVAVVSWLDCREREALAYLIEENRVGLELPILALNPGLRNVARRHTSDLR
jgi:hypothetical protein